MTNFTTTLDHNVLAPHKINRGSVIGYDAGMMLMQEGKGGRRICTFKIATEISLLQNPSLRSCQVLIFVGVGMSWSQIDGDEEGKIGTRSRGTVTTAAPRALVPASPEPVVSSLIWTMIMQ